MAEDNNTSVNNVNTEGNNAGTQNEGNEPKTYTEEEVLKLIQSESDRRCNMALAKQKKEYEKKISLASLDEQQRKEAEAQMKIEELQNQLTAFQMEKNKSELKSVLASRNLDVRFADIISITEDLEESQKNIETLDTLFKAAVKAEVEKRLAGNAPKGGAETQKEITKDSIKRMSISELNKLAIEQPELFERLMK